MTQIFVVAKELITRRVDFKKCSQPDFPEKPKGCVTLNPGNRRYRGDVDDADEKRGEGDASQGADSKKRKKKPHPDIDDDDPRYCDPETILSPENTKYPLSWPRAERVGSGLRNLGNSCYLNSVLQCVAYCPPLAHLLMAVQPATRDATFDPLYALGQTVVQMHRSSGAISPNQIVGNLRALSRQLKPGQQCDAQEFANALLDSCQMAQLRRMAPGRKLSLQSQHTTPMMRVIGGYLQSSVSWTAREEVQALRRENNAAWSELHKYNKEFLASNTYEPFSVLNLAIVGNSLEDCLSRFCQPERLDGKIYKTPRNVYVNAEKRFLIHVPPQVLIIHLKRFTNRAAKISKRVSFGLHLDLAPFVSQHHASSPAASKIMYNLTGVVVHRGSSVEYGHYTAYIKGSNGSWFNCDDSHVSSCGTDEVLRCESYMLWYTMAAPNTPVKPTDTQQQPKNKGAKAEAAASSWALKAHAAESGANSGEIFEDLGKVVDEREVAARVRAMSKGGSSPVGKPSARSSNEQQAGGRSPRGPVPIALPKSVTAAPQAHADSREQKAKVHPWEAKNQQKAAEASQAPVNEPKKVPSPSPKSRPLSSSPRLPSTATVAPAPTAKASPKQGPSIPHEARADVAVDANEAEATPPAAVVDARQHSVPAAVASAPRFGKQVDISEHSRLFGATGTARAAAKDDEIFASEGDDDDEEKGPGATVAPPAKKSRLERNTEGSNSPANRAQPPQIVQPFVALLPSSMTSGDGPKPTAPKPKPPSPPVKPSHDSGIVSARNVRKESGGDANGASGGEGKTAAEQLKQRHAPQAATLKMQSHEGKFVSRVHDEGYEMAIDKPREKKRKRQREQWEGGEEGGEGRPRGNRFQAQADEKARQRQAEMQ